MVHIKIDKIVYNTGQLDRYCIFITINFENPNLHYYLLNHLDVFLKKTVIFL